MAPITSPTTRHSIGSPAAQITNTVTGAMLAAPVSGPV